MDYIFLIAAAIVILTCFYFIISPFFSVNEAHATGAGDDEETLTLDQIYSAVNEVEMDYLMKKITAEDFEKLKEQYQLLASKLLKEESGTKKHAGSKKRTDEAEAEILEELRKLRKQKG